MKEKIVLIGGGGHCRSVIDVIETEGRFEIAGIVDAKEKRGSKVLGYELFACDDDLAELCKQYTYFHISIGFIKPNSIRTDLYHKLKLLGAQFPIICSPSSIRSKHAQIGEGTVLMHQAIVNAGATIGVNCILNSQALIEHDAVIGDHCHISTAAIINGECTVGQNCFIGSGSVLLNGIHIQSNCIIGAGAVVSRSVEKSGSTMVGNPAKEINT